MLLLSDVIESLTGTRLEKLSLVISETFVDSRLVIPGAMFVALPGDRVDGHQFLNDAFRRGALFALVNKDLPETYPVLDLRSGTISQDLVIPPTPFCILVNDPLLSLQQISGFWRRKLSPVVIGITGSIGKSTTKELVGEVLSQRFRTIRNIGNLNNEIGLPLTLLRLTEGTECAVLEMGFYLPGEISLLCNLALPQIGLVTNIGPVHAERAGSLEAIAQGKAELLQALPSNPEGVAVLNADDPLVKAMADKTRARVFYYGLDPSADLWADQIEGLGLAGIRFRLHYRKEILNLRVPLIGRHSVHTALRAAAIGLILNLSWHEIIKGLQQGYSQLRLIAVHTKNGALLLDDTYNASPESNLAALNLLGEIEGRKIAVLGEMYELGPYEVQAHEIVGARVAEVCDELIAVGEKSKIIVDSATRAGFPSVQITWLPGVPETINFLRNRLHKGDVVLIKGSRGLAMERIVAALETSS